jgi:hypothetical protein
MSETTDADRERAAGYVLAHPHLAGVVAQALADERERVVWRCWRILDDWGKNRGSAVAWKILGLPMQDIRRLLETDDE